MKPWVIHCVAHYMARIIEENMDEDGNIDFISNVALHSIFGDVPEYARADVYIKLLEMLHERGIEFAPEQAQNFELN